MFSNEFIVFKLYRIGSIFQWGLQNLSIGNLSSKKLYNLKKNWHITHNFRHAYDKNSPYPRYRMPQRFPNFGPQTSKVSPATYHYIIFTPLTMLLQKTIKSSPLREILEIFNVPNAAFPYSGNINPLRPLFANQIKPLLFWS